MQRKPKIKKKNGGDHIIETVFQQVVEITGVPSDQFSNRKNLDRNIVLARSIALLLLRLSGLGLSVALEPFGLRSTQTVYQAVGRVREAVGNDPNLEMAIRRACATLGVDPTPLLGSEQKTTPLLPAEEAMSVLHRAQDAIHTVFLPNDELFSGTGISSAGLSCQVLVFVLVADYNHEPDAAGARVGMDRKDVFVSLGTVWYLDGLGGDVHDKLKAVRKLLAPAE